MMKMTADEQLQRGRVKGGQIETRIRRSSSRSQHDFKSTSFEEYEGQMQHLHIYTKHMVHETRECSEHEESVSSTDENEEKSFEYNASSHVQGDCVFKSKACHVRFKSSVVTEIHLCPKIKASEYSLLYYSAHELQKLLDDAKECNDYTIPSYIYSESKEDDYEDVQFQFDETMSSTLNSMSSLSLYDSYFG